jgi:hypothetical protein
MTYKNDTFIITLMFNVIMTDSKLRVLFLPQRLFGQ